MRCRWLGVVCVVFACEQEPGLPIVYETEHLRIGTDLEHPLCAGDLAAYEAIIQRVDDELGLTMDAKVNVSIWSDDAWATVRPDYCDSGPRTLGCMDYDRNTIFTSLPVLDHELVHAATPIPNLTPFFAEGLADVYGGYQSRFGSTAPADSLELSGTKMDRWVASHFVRWLRETWGPAKLGELARHGKHADKRFADVYGLSFATAQAKFFAEAPWGYPGLYTCGGAPLDAADDLGSWAAVVGLGCEDGEDVRAVGTGVMTLRTFDIPVAGHYSVSTDADGFTLSLCATGPIEDAIPYNGFLDADVPPSYAGDLSENFAIYMGGPTKDLYFEAGKTEIGLFSFGYEDREVAVSIWPTLGPRPVEGGN